MTKYIFRTIEENLNNIIGMFPVIIITGPRQVGKKTLLNNLILNSKEKINYISLSNMFIRAQANEEPELFLRTHECPLIIDEFQYAPNLLSYIKINVDEARKNSLFGDGKYVGTMYYLTGSQVFQTMEDVSESLAGRVGILDLYGLSTREIYSSKEELFIPDINVLKNKEKNKKLSTIKLFERILLGSFPEVIKNKESKDKFYDEYIRTYIERDIRNLINIKDETKF